MRFLLPFLSALSVCAQDPGYTIPLIDLAADASRQAVVDREPGQYLGHPNTVLLEDGKTIVLIYAKGHARGPLVLRRSTDGGLTWSDRLPVPENWATSKEGPTVHRVIDANGRKRLALFSGTYPIRMSLSEDDGVTWTPLAPIGEFGAILAMGDVMRLKDGRYLAVFHDDGTSFRPNGVRGQYYVYQTISSDGGRTWSTPVVAATHKEARLCTPALIRSPDGRQIAMLMRESSRKLNSFVAVSDDEGATWSAPRQVAGALTGDRHLIRYAPDGRLVITFRDTTRESPTKGDWAAWVGTYEDMVNGREGQYRVRLMDNTKAIDCCYGGLAALPGGTFLATAYGHWNEGEEPYIASVRFRLDELDARAAVPFDEPLARVVRAYNAPGHKSRLHKHDVNRVMIHLTPGRMLLDFRDEPDQDVKFRAGDVRWDPKGGLHTSENTGADPFRMIQVELKTAGNPNVAYAEADPLRAAPAQYKRELENDQVRVLRVRYAAGESQPAVRHVLPRYAVFLTPAHVRVSGDGGRTREVQARAGDCIRLNAGESFAGNVGGQPMEAVLVELKSR